MVLVVTIVQIPQRFMLVNGLSAIEAGVRLLPFAAVVAFTSVIVAVVISKAGIPAVNALIVGSLVQIAGVVGLSKSSTQPGIQASQYGFQILAGVGVGIYNIVLILLTPHVVDMRQLGILFLSPYSDYLTDTAPSCGERSCHTVQNPWWVYWSIDRLVCDNSRSTRKSSSNLDAGANTARFRPDRDHIHSIRREPSACTRTVWRHVQQADECADWNCSG